MVGKTVGHYQVLAELGAGGMGVVYRARDLKLGREVALKFLPAAAARNQTAVERFEREARAAAGINHPNICTVLEVGENEGSPFIAMELLDGETLKARLNGQPLPLEALLDCAIQITDGLAAAHERHIIHRDIKPGNLFVTSRGHAKIVDFGLAKESPRGVDATQDLITDPGTVAGTPNYMSPEQARGLPLDCRTDLFSLGAVLYEMATGNMPFSGATMGEVLGAILHEAPDLVAVQSAGRPAELKRIIGKALEKDRDLRYQHAADMGADLKRLRRDTGPRQSLATSGSLASKTTSLVPTAASAPKRKSKVMSLLITAAVLAAAVGAYYLATRSRGDGFPTMSMERLTNVGEVRKAAISPDGKYLAFTAGNANEPSLWIRQLATHSDLQILPTTAGSFEGITFSGDDNYLYYVRFQGDEDSGQLFRMATLGSPPEDLERDRFSGDAVARR